MTERGTVLRMTAHWSDRSTNIWQSIVVNDHAISMASLGSVRSENSQASVQDIDQKLEENAEQQRVLVGLMTKGYLGPANYRKSNNDLIHEAEHLKRYKESLINILDNGSQHIRKVGELLQFTPKADMLTQYDGDLFSRFVKRIVVRSRTEISFELECGLTLSERLVK